MKKPKRSSHAWGPRGNRPGYRCGRCGAELILRKRPSKRVSWEQRYVRGDIDQPARPLPPCEGEKLADKETR